MSERVSKMSRGATIVDAPIGAMATPPDLARMAAVMMNGWTAIGSQMMSFSKSSLEASMAAAEEMRNCQSPRDLIEVQMRYARSNYERCLDEMREMSGVLARCSSEAIETMIPGAPS